MTALNDNRTHIYRILRKRDGLFLVSLCYGGAHGEDAGVWGPTGTFWKTPQTIKDHLLELCEYRVYCSEGGSVFDLRGRRRGPRQQARDELNPFWVIYGCDTPVHHVKTMLSWLDRYQVVATEITIHSNKTIPAADFFGESMMNLQAAIGEGI